jgi:hypothetical protein
VYLSLRTAVEGRVERPASDALESQTNLIHRSLCEAQTLQNSIIFDVT